MTVKIPDCGFKFRVENEKHSKRLQETLFRYGAKWWSGHTTVKLINKPFLYLDDFIIWGDNAIYFEKHEAKEITLKQFINFMEKIKFSYTIYGKKR